MSFSQLNKALQALHRRRAKWVIIMSLISLSLKHGQSPDLARSRLEDAVKQIQQLCGSIIQHVVWSADRSWVRLEGTGFWLEIKIDAQDVHASGDISALGGLLEGPLSAALKQIMQQSFQRQLR